MIIYKDLDKLHHIVREALISLMTTIHAEQLHFKIFETWRDPLRQMILYCQGREYPGAKITWSKMSLHSVGLAVDFVLCDSNGNLTSDSWKYEGYEDRWDRFGELAKQYGFEWGGDWKTPDRPHIQISGGLTIEQIIYDNYDNVIPFRDYADIAYIKELEIAREYYKLLISSCNQLVIR